MSRTLLGWEKRISYWKNFEGLCCEETCQRFLRCGDGLFCANFYDERGPDAPCKGAWCGPSYKPLGNKPYPIKLLLDEDGEVLDAKEKGCFMCGRAGDHLMTSFQCELCHFRNVMGRDPVNRDAEDIELFEIFRRANLDAFWERSTSTVKSNLREAMRSERFADRVRMPSLTPPMGPFPWKIHWGCELQQRCLTDHSTLGCTTIWFSGKHSTERVQP